MVWVGRNVKDLVPMPLLWAEMPSTRPLNHVAQSPIQPDLGCLQDFPCTPWQGSNVILTQYRNEHKAKGISFCLCHTFQAQKLHLAMPFYLKESSVLFRVIILLNIAKLLPNPIISEMTQLPDLFLAHVSTISAYYEKCFKILSR